MKRQTIRLMIFIFTHLLALGLLSPRIPLAFSHDRHPSYTDYYPVYRPFYPKYKKKFNPVVRRDHYSSEGYAPDGTYHQEDAVIDRHSSYYSRGRNEAITKPKTTVRSWTTGPGQETTREKTTWIGADGRPHSTTITRDTSIDRWGNTHTDTHVQLRKAKP